jgi:hypothetical protein
VPDFERASFFLSSGKKGATSGQTQYREDGHNEFQEYAFHGTLLFHYECSDVVLYH